MNLEKRAKKGFLGRIRNYIFGVGLGLATLAGCVYPTSPTVDPYATEKQAITRAADRLVETQNNDGGWEWENPDTIKSTGPSAYNTFGITAMGLLSAYKVTEDPNYLGAAKITGDTLVSVDTNTGISSTNTPTSQGSVKFYSQDIEFLMKLGEFSGNSIYTNKANEIMNAFLNNANRYVNHTNMTAEELNAAYKTSFPSGSGNEGQTEWSLASWARAAKATGHNNFATDLSTRMAADMPSYFDPQDPIQNVYILGLAGELSATGNNSIEQILINAQNEDGTWNDLGSDPNGIVQNTAYAVMSLLVGSGSTEAMNTAHKAVRVGIEHQEANGGWIESNGKEYSEADSEVTQAISDYITR